MRRRKHIVPNRMSGYVAFCAGVGAAPFPADDAVFNDYMRSLEGRIRHTFQLHRRAIVNAHRNMGLPPPRVDRDVRDLERRAPRRRGSLRTTIGEREVQAMLRTLDPTAATEARDGAMCVLRFVHGYTAAALCALRVEDVSFFARGVAIKGIPIEDGDSPLSGWMRAWLANHPRERGALFLGWDRRGYWNRGPLCRSWLYMRLVRAARLAGLINPALPRGARPALIPDARSARRG